MGSAYIELLPPDRPIHMVGSPIIKLVASGGPGGDLGDLATTRRNINVSGSPYVSPAALSGATPMPIYGTLGCCGADGPDMGNFGMPMSDAAADTVKLLDGRCDKIESQAQAIADKVRAANADSTLTQDQKNQVAVQAQGLLKTLSKQWRDCRSRLKKIIKSFKDSGNLKEFGLSDIDEKLSEQEKLARCRAKIQAIRALVNGDKKNGNGQPKA